MALSIVDSRPHNLESVRAPSLFPSAIEESAKTLMDFIQRYYDYMNSVGLPSYEIANITREKDIDIVSDKYLTEIQSVIARNIPNSRVLDKVSLYKIILQYYRTRGSEDSIHTFFKIFFDEAVNIFYPRDYLFDLSSGHGSWVDLDLITLRVINANPNKTRMSITTDVRIAPAALNPQSSYTFVFKSYSNTAWTLDGAAPLNQPRIVRNVTDNRWVYKYEDYGFEIESVNDALWPDEADWTTSFISNITYNEVDGNTIVERDIGYSTTVITPGAGTIILPTHGVTTESGGTDYITTENGTAEADTIITEAAQPATIDTVTRDIIYTRIFTVTAIAESATRINDVINSDSTTRETANDGIYRVSSLSPLIWERLSEDQTSIWQYTDSRSFPSDRYKLHDGVFWQKYSYQIKSSLPLDEWSYDYLRFVHPSGLKLFAALLFQLFARTEWNNVIDYSALRPETDISWLNSYRPPTAGAHTPTYQPGWFTANSRVRDVFAAALQSDAEREILQRLVLLSKALFHIASAGYVTAEQNAFIAQDISLREYYTNVNWNYSFIDFESTVSGYSNALVTLEFENDGSEDYQYSAIAPRENPYGGPLYIEDGISVLVNENGGGSLITESPGN